MIAVYAFTSIPLGNVSCSDDMDVACKYLGWIMTLSRGSYWLTLLLHQQGEGASRRGSGKFKQFPVPEQGYSLSSSTV